MRLALLVVSFLVAIAGSAISSQFAVLSYVWFTVMRPDLLAWSYQPYIFTLALVCLFSSLRNIANIDNLFRNPFSLMLLAQQVLILFSVLLAIRTDLALEPYNRYIRVIVMALLIPLVITTEIWFRRLILTIVVSIGFLAVKFGLFGLVTGGTALNRGLQGGMMADSNGLALANVMAVPLAWYAIGMVNRLWQKLALAVVVLCGVSAIILTGSRGNSLAMALLALLLVSRTKYKAAGLAAMVLVSVPALYLAGQRYQERMATISEYEEEASASTRVTLWKASLFAMRDHPLLGVGYGEKNWVAVSPNYLGISNHLVVHNTYLQMGVDCGVPLMLLYASTLWGAVFWLQKSARRMDRLRPEWAAYPKALQGSILGFALGSTFYSRGDFELIYIVLMSASSWYLLEKRWLLHHAAAATQPPRTAPVPAPALAPTLPGPGPGLAPAQYKFGGRPMRKV